MEEKIVFVGKVLDNVHGFINYTEAESHIMNTLLFKRLQSIKQLSVVNWIFPGSEHTRYIHSLGVMYIADKIAVQLELPDKERKIIRLAGLLHDIGHYPLSHVCEFPYKKDLESFPDNSFCKSINEFTKERIDSLNQIVAYDYMKKSSGLHHEQLGASIVLHNEEIRNIIVKECGEEAPEIIADMIIGNIEHSNTNPLYVQILHSELDADGIDYLMRDALFSGTSFGSFELEQLIRCMKVDYFLEKPILCINPKGIAAADQFLINKFFSYSQIVYNKHISITEWMAKQIVNWMQKNNAFFPKSEILKGWVESKNINEKYIDFTDNFFWSSLQSLLNNPLADTEPNFIKNFCLKLLRHNELDYVEDSEVKIVLSNPNDIKDIMTNSNSYKLLSRDDMFAILLEQKITKQVKNTDFEDYLNKIFFSSKDEECDDCKFSEEDKNNLKIRRFMECVCVSENGNIKLLCDDERSLIFSIYNLKLVILRFFKMPA